MKTYISAHQKLSEAFIEKHSDKVSWDYIFQCGKLSRCIRILREDPTKIKIGCFYGAQEEAIEAINKKYSGQDSLDYISKVNECFLF